MIDFKNKENYSVDYKKKTDLLFVKRSFWTGFSSILDISASDKKFNKSKTALQADCNALYSDWEMVGEDIYEALDNIKLEKSEQEQ